jgi:outer membrane protein assembly factor BamB
MKKCVLPILAILVAALLSCGNRPPVDKGHDWPRWRGPNGDGVSKETDWNPRALAGGAKVLWKLAIGSGYSAVVVHGNRVYTLGRDADNTTVYCVNADNGRKLWTHTYQGGFDAYGPAATPTVEEGSVYTLGSAGEIYRFDAGNGKVKWNKNLVEEYNVLKPRYGFAASPVVEGELLIVTCNSYGIALNKKTGALVWTSPTTDANSQGCSMTDAYATPVIYSRNGRRYLCQFDDYGVYAVDIQTGQPSWFFSWPPEKAGDWSNVADPIVFEGEAFISTGFGVGCALLDLSSGTPSVVWQNKNMNNHVSTCVLVDGFLYGCHDPIGWGAGGVLLRLA